MILKLFLSFILILNSYYIFAQNKNNRKIIAEKYNALQNLEKTNIRNVCVDTINNIRYFSTKNLGIIKEDSNYKINYLFDKKEIYGAFVLDKKRKNGVFVAFAENATKTRFDTIKVKEKDLKNKIDFSKIQIKKTEFLTKNKGYEYIKEVIIKVGKYETKIKNIADTLSRFQQAYILDTNKVRNLTFVKTVFADDDHVWVGTEGQGTFVFYRNNTKPILNVSKLYTIVQQLNSKVKTINKITEFQGLILLATSNGIYSVPKNISKIKKLNKELKKQNITCLATRKNTIYAGDSQGNIWKKITNNHKKSHWEKIEMDTSFRQTLGHINDMNFDKNGNLWVAGNKIIRFSRDTTKEVRKGENEFSLELIFDTELGFKAKQANSVAIDDKDKVFIGSNMGVYYIDNESQKQDYIQIKSFKAFKLSKGKLKRTKRIKNIFKFQVIFEKDNLKVPIDSLRFKLINIKNKEDNYSLKLSNINEGGSNLIVHDLTYGIPLHLQKHLTKKEKEEVKKPKKQAKYKLVIFYDDNPISAINLFL